MRPVAYTWSGTLASGKHNYSFSASDGLATTSSPTSGNFNVFRLELGNLTPFTFVALYVGQGNISYRPYPQLLGPPGLGAIDRFELKIPQNATLLQFINISFDYRLTTSLTEFNETSIAFWWLDGSTWTRVETSGLDTQAKIVWINHTKDGIFGVFGNRTVLTRPPTAVIKTTNGRTVFEPNEAIEFSAAESFDPNNAPLSYLWDFGDGNNSTARIANHSYAEPGNYIVKLRVTNSYNLVDNKTVTITVRSSASTNFFLGIAIAIVAALFVLFVLWPVWSRRGRRGGGAPPPGPTTTSVREEEDELQDPRTRMAVPSVVRRNGGALTDDEERVVDELDREFENQSSGRPPE